MLKVGITGGIGSGKSVVCKIFETLGVPIYYADDRAKQLMHEDTALMAAIKDRFGADIYQDGVLNRQKLSELVFNDKAALQDLNALVHPAVGRDSKAWQQQQTAPYTLREAALLFEAGSYKLLDKIIVVTAPKALRIDRVMQRDGVSKEQVQARMANQWPQADKDAKADYLIINDGNHELIPQVMELHKKLLSLADQ